MSVTGKVLGSLILAVVGLVVYLSTYVGGVLGIPVLTLLFWYGLVGTFVMLALVVYISAIGQDEEFQP